MVSDTKAFDPQAAGRSVRELPPASGIPGQGVDTSLLWMVAQIADDIPEWGTQPKMRDAKLRKFATNESTFSSALGTVAIRNAAFSWAIEGPGRTANRMHEVLDNANMGEGWLDMMTKVSIDLHTQDTGAFIEVVREGNNPESPVIGLNHLDAFRCYHTGRPEKPVIYQDQKGRYHLLDWWNILSLAEMPMPVEGLPGLQLSAVSRVLRASQVRRNITQYIEEKTAGRHTKAIHLVKGMTATALNDALDKYRERATSQGLLRYVQPLIVPSIDPKADIGVTTLDMATLPDGWSDEDQFKQYLTVLSMGFLTDYQEFAPLPGGSLGSSAQSQVLHMKSRGKGPGLFMKMMTHALNFTVMPKNCEFKYNEQDIEADKVEAENRKLRAEARHVMVTNGELNAMASLQMAVDEGDIPVEIAEKYMMQPDLTEDITAEDDEQPDEQPPGKPSGVPAQVPGQQQQQVPPGKQPPPTKERFRFDFEHYV